MTRYKFEAGEGDSDDLPEIYQPIKPIRTKRSRKQAGSGTSGSRPKRPPARKEAKLYSAKRTLISAQRGVFAAAVSEALGDHESSITKLNISQPYVSILAHKHARRILMRHFASGKERPAAIDDFNGVVSQYVKTVNQEAPAVRARLEAVEISGVTDPQYNGPTYLGIRISGVGGEDVKQVDGDNLDLLTALSAAELCTIPFNPRGYASRMATSFAVTYSYENAVATRDSLNEAGVAEMITSRLVTPDNPEGFAIFGRLVENPIPIKAVAL